MNITIVDILPYIVTIVTCYITIKVCLERHDIQIKQIEKLLDSLTEEVKKNNEVKLRVNTLEGQTKTLFKELEWIKKEK